MIKFNAEYNRSEYEAPNWCPAIHHNCAALSKRFISLILLAPLNSAGEIANFAGFRSQITINKK